MEIRDTKACVSCRSAKIKCDKLRPCTRCLKRDEKCRPQAVGAQLGEPVKLPVVDWRQLVKRRGREGEGSSGIIRVGQKIPARATPPTSPHHAQELQISELREAQLAISEVVVRWVYSLVNKRKVAEDKSSLIMSAIERGKDKSGHDIYPGLVENLNLSCGLSPSPSPRLTLGQDPSDAAKLTRLMHCHTGRDLYLAAMAWPLGGGLCVANELFQATFCSPQAILAVFTTLGITPSFFAAWLVDESDRDDFCTSLAHAFFSQQDVSKRLLQIRDARGLTLSCISRLRVLSPSDREDPVLLLTFQRAPPSRHLQPGPSPPLPPPLLEGLAAVGSQPPAPQEALPTVLPACQLGYDVKPAEVQKLAKAANRECFAASSNLDDILSQTASHYAPQTQLPTPTLPPPAPPPWARTGPSTRPGISLATALVDPHPHPTSTSALVDTHPHRPTSSTSRVSALVDNHHRPSATSLGSALVDNRQRPSGADQTPTAPIIGRRIGPAPQLIQPLTGAPRGVAPSLPATFKSEWAPGEQSLAFEDLFPQQPSSQLLPAAPPTRGPPTHHTSDWTATLDPTSSVGSEDTGEPPAKMARTSAMGPSLISATGPAAAPVEDWPMVDDEGELVDPEVLQSILEELM